MFDHKHSQKSETIAEQSKLMMAKTVTPTNVVWLKYQAGMYALHGPESGSARHKEAACPCADKITADDTTIQIALC